MRRLGRGEEACADVHALGSEHERGRQPASVGDASRREHRERRDGCDDLRHEREGSDRGAEPARLAALRDDHVDAEFGCRVRLLTVCTCWTKIAPAPCARSTRSPGSPSAKDTTAGSRVSAAANASSANGRAVKLTANGRSVSSRTRSIRPVTWSGLRSAVPTEPSPPASDTAAGSSAFVQGPIEPCITGASIPRTSQTGVRT